MNASSLIDPAPVLRMALLGVVVALVPLALTWGRWRKREGSNGSVGAAARPAPWLRALLLTTLILTFDLVLFGSFTRLTDSGLGCPDWPGCYGHASPLGAKASIDAAVAQQPDGPVTHGKAWIEMIHRYFAMAVGLLIVFMTVEAWRQYLRAKRIGLSTHMVSPWWPTATLVWVLLQGAFGALTVTMRLYPAIVTTHLLLGMGLLAMLAGQWQARGHAALEVSRLTRGLAYLVALLLLLQLALGGWVSTNYAVLACSDFPTCQGRWWPEAMDFEQGFTLRRALGRSGDGASYLPFAALTAIHMAHRVGALLLVLAMGALAIVLSRHTAPEARRLSLWLVALAVWQILSGASNVVLGWPILAALGHVAGAAGLTVVLTRVLVQTRAVQSAQRREALLPTRLAS
jgi:heme a synthase